MEDETPQQSIRRTESGYRFELSGLRSAVADAMIFIGAAKSPDDFNAAINHATAAVDALEDHLAAYWDDKYAKDKFGKVDNRTKKKERTGGFVAIETVTADDMRLKHPDEEDPDKLERMAEEMNLNARREQLRLRVQALIRLQDRKNLLLEEQTDDYAGY